MIREDERRPEVAEQGMGQHDPEDPKAKFTQMVEGAKDGVKSGGNYLPKKVLPEDWDGQTQFNEIDHEEVMYHADLAKALKQNPGKRVDELPQDVQVDLGVRFTQLKKKIEDFNQQWEGK